MKSFVSSLFFFILLIISVQAKVWNVNVNCLSDTITNGDSENIDVAFANCNPGDIIEISSGTYVYSIQNTVDTSGNYFLRLPSDNVHIYGVSDVVIDGEDTTIILKSDYADSVVIENITFTRGYNETISSSQNSYPSVLDLYSADSWVIINNVFYNNNQSDSLGGASYQAKGNLIILGRWNEVKDNVFDSNAFFVDGVCDTINSLIYCDYADTFIGNTFRNNLIWNISDNQKTICGLVYYNRAVTSSYWYNNRFDNNSAFNYNSLSGAVSLIWQENYYNNIDKITGDSNVAYGNYYFDSLVNSNITDTDLITYLYILKVNNIGIDLFNTLNRNGLCINSIAIDLYDLLPYIPSNELYRYRDYLMHGLYRRRVR